MKKTVQISVLGVCFIVLTAFSKCDSSDTIQEEPPSTIGKVYYQEWIAGVEGGGSGLNLFIPVENNQIELDSVYFRERATKLEKDGMSPYLYIGRFSNSFNTKKDMVMSNKPNAEYGNELPKKREDIPYELGDYECIVSYVVNGETKYFKIKNIIEKQSIGLPSAPPKNDN